MELIYSGSVKDIYSDKKELVFKYSNRYSVFDWGEMPDEIPHKGEALASMAASFFEYLKTKGIDSHFIEQTASDSIRVKQVNVLRPEWIEGKYDYSIYQDTPTQTLVPLEVIFRRFLGQGNSLQKRLEKNPAYLQDLGLPEMPDQATSFSPALVEFSTKLESTDRYLSRQEIEEMEVVSAKELESIKAATQKIASLLEELFAKLSIKLWDGKFEFAFGAKADSSREIFLVDSIGPDELRLTYEGLPLSKEFLRQVYASSEWAKGVQRAKELAQERKTQDWKKICTTELNLTPAKLTNEQKEVSSLLYMALANEVAEAVGRNRPFDSAANLKSWVQRAQELLRV